MAVEVGAKGTSGKALDAAPGYLRSHEPDIEEGEELERQKNPSRQFKRFWASLTRAQKEAMRRVYIKNPDGLTKIEIAQELGIRVDTLQERIEYAVKKFKRFYPRPPK